MRLEHFRPWSFGAFWVVWCILEATIPKIREIRGKPGQKPREPAEKPRKPSEWPPGKSLGGNMANF